MSSRIRWIFCTFWPTGTFLVVRLSVCLLPDLSWALPILFAIESPLIADQRSHSKCGFGRRECRQGEPFYLRTVFAVI